MSGTFLEFNVSDVRLWWIHCDVIFWSICLPDIENVMRYFNVNQVEKKNDTTKMIYTKKRRCYEIQYIQRKMISWEDTTEKILTRKKERKIYEWKTVNIGLRNDMIQKSKYAKKNEKTLWSEKDGYIRKIDKNLFGMWSLDNCLFSS